MLGQKLFTALILFFMLNAHSQITLRLTSLPPDTPKDAKFYMASSLNGWKPSDALYEFKNDDKNVPALTLQNLKEPVQYKITRGSWETVEGDENGGQAGNRTLIAEGRNQTENLRILSWQKQVYKQKTKSANVHLLSDSFYMPQLDKSRRIWIYLPPGYESSTRRYPVVYMHDAQNLFDDATSYSGEWGVDETLDKLAAEGKRNVIVVGIENGGDSRLNEYSPWKNQKYGGGEGAKYADFLAMTLKTYIDKHYRTRPQPAHTGLIGSSMGGLITLYTGLKYPEKFGRLGIFSPSIWFAKNDVSYFIKKNTKRLSGTKFYFVAGRKESAEMVNDLEQVAEQLRKEGVKGKNIKVKVDDYGAHTESYWRGEFDDAYEWLFSVS